MNRVQAIEETLFRYLPYLKQVIPALLNSSPRPALSVLRLISYWAKQVRCFKQDYFLIEVHPIYLQVLEAKNRIETILEKIERLHQQKLFEHNRENISQRQLPLRSLVYCNEAEIISHLLLRYICSVYLRELNWHLRMKNKLNPNSPKVHIHPPIL